MNTTIIFIIAAAIALLIIIYSFRTSEEIDDKPVIKFEPRQVTDLSVASKKPKRKYKKRNNKKPTVAENTIVEKKSVGRPKISK